MISTIMNQLMQQQQNKVNTAQMPAPKINTSQAGGSGQQDPFFTYRPNYVGAATPPATQSSLISEGLTGNPVYQDPNFTYEPPYMAQLLNRIQNQQSYQQSPQYIANDHLALSKYNRAAANYHPATYYLAQQIAPFMNQMSNAVMQSGDLLRNSSNLPGVSPVAAQDYNQAAKIYDKLAGPGNQLGSLRAMAAAAPSQALASMLADVRKNQIVYQGMASEAFPNIHGKYDVSKNKFLNDFLQQVAAQGGVFSNSAGSSTSLPGPLTSNSSSSIP
jgi:hypothetical protein